MIEVGDEYLGYSVIATDGDYITIVVPLLPGAPLGPTLIVSKSGIEGGLKELLCIIGVSAAC